MSWARFAGIRIFSASLPVVVFLLCSARLGTAGQGDAEPPAADQQKILNAMRQYASEYIDKLPNFICEQITSQYEAGRKPTHWHKGDVLTAKLVFNQGKEQRHLEMVNNKTPDRTSHGWRTPLVTEGEFGILLGNVLGEAADAKFSWSRWDTIRDKRVAVFDYSVDAAHSTLSLSLSDLAKAVVPYHGSVYADPETGAVWRITSETSEIPDSVRTKSIETIIDYSQVQIGESSYLLPLEAKVLMVTDSNNIRNEMAFEAYRKFEAESTITFTPETTETPHQ